MSNTKEYEKVSGGSNNNVWAPHKDTTKVYSDSNPAVMEGYYLRSNVITQTPPKKDFEVHEFHEVNEDGSLGDILDVSLGIGLSNTLNKITTGTCLRLEYKGKKPAKIPGQSFNDVAVLKIKGVTPYMELLGTASVDLPATNSGKAQGGKDVVAKNSPFPDDNDDLPFNREKTKFQF